MNNISHLLVWVEKEGTAVTEELSQEGEDVRWSCSNRRPERDEDTALGEAKSRTF
jgi:hypothetical protein